MKRMRKTIPFYVINSVFRKGFEKYNIMPYLLSAYDDMYKNTPKDKRPSTFKDMLNFVKNESMYQFWGRCEYEILLGHWPYNENDKWEKIDVYWQIQMNIETVTRIFIENLGLDIKESY